ncbi:ABC-F family ATP-binding cassette domain-containing protein [Caulobacter sp. BE254]|uniref:ABC-F family ATP-binding cassette domain-containing protein n=1 Tax=Caulobacter sp. BE254 TaxID=2817720 RepID=UPI0028657575|nr:ABC-F family ATP-binding cassette domain-containing protein [Caulobacter sp. BE254]MDR7117688.1 ATPase subunit of ABC transporter with duplicated ATPase domains [Caulobacter sp. BE254]
MPAFITLDSVRADTPDGRVLFDNLNLTIGAERIGLVGRNGVGKSTLLSLIAGTSAPVSGTVGRVGVVGVLPQLHAPPPGARLADLLGVGPAWDRLCRIEADEGTPETLEEDLIEADWTLPGRVAAALGEVGLSRWDASAPAASLSGGQMTRAALAGLLVAAPDVILLDEPTNNLDAAARSLLADVLRRWKGGAVVVSHDRALLRGMDRIVELSSLGATSYGGGYDLYAERKAQAVAAAEHDLEAAERQVRQAAREAQIARERKARRDAAGRRFAARGSEPKILLGAQAERAENTGAREGRLADRAAQDAAQAREVADARVERLRRLAFDLPSCGLPAGRIVLDFDAVGFAYPDGPPVLTDLSFRLTGPERVALVGGNGAGKSTLIRLAVGDLEPTAGVVTRGVRAALLDQRVAVLDEAQTILENFRRLNPAAGANEAHAALARFLFRNVAAHQAVATLSGGERLRAALACVLMAADPPQLLILDEPTNHLDLDSVEAVENALAGYDGALLIASHDEDFLDAVGVERRIALPPG